MAITTSQWSHVLTIPESYIPSSATSGQTLVITESVIAKLSAGDQTTFWSNVQNGGGDVRICTDSGGVNQLPVEVVSLDNSAQTCVIWTRKPSYSGTGDLYLFIGKAGETQPPITDTFGRNAVWQDDTHRQGADGLTDVTGETTISLSGSATQGGTVNGFNAVDIDGTNASGGVFDSTDTENWTSDFTVSAWVNLDNFNSGFANIIGIRNRTTWEFSFRLEGNQPAMLIGTASPNSTGSLSSASDHMLHATVSGSTISFFLNGSAIGTASVSGSRTNRTLDLTFGGVEDNTADGTSINGRIAEARAINGTAIPSSKIATEYANQSDPATFFGTPTLATTGGGGGGLTLIPALIPSGEMVGTPSVTNLLQLVEANVIPTQEAVQTPVIDTGAILISPATIPTGEVVYNVSVVDLTEFIEAENIPTQEVVGSPNLELLLSRIFPTAIATQENFETPLIIGGDRIAIPINDRATWNRVAAYLRTRKFNGNDNDVILAWLRSEGYTDTFNDALNTYLEDVEALEGSLTDKYSNWRRQ